MQGIEGRVAVVTGAGSGIGRASARALAAAGASIVAGNRDRAAGESLVAEITAQGGVCTFIPTDVTKTGDIARLMDEAVSRHGRLDILFNNAGTILRTPAAQHPDEYWDKIIEINLNSQFILAREIGKGMLERHSGKIVFTASLLTFQGGITVPGYAASKAGIGSLIKALANE